ENRKKAAPEVATHIETTLKSLGIKNARLRIDLKKTETYLLHGKDELELLFSANKGIAYEKLHKVASGGELSRIMLAVKALLAQYTSLPAIIFDEIDTGVSGAIAGNVGEIIRQMSATMQVIAITHLPQVAAKGDTHFKVYKEDGTHDTRTGIKQLDVEERIAEIAAMLGGKDSTESAVAHARNLLSS
ncbi:MAG: DNA repair protein RecN, partial [Sinomicrobium sp.]|nr:DNA repair protein RecN [Sinomicrobium sp.]